MSTVDVSLVSWNSAAHVRSALQSLASQTLHPQSVTVVDNGSTDGSAEIAAAFAGTDVLRLHENQGFAGAHNHSIRQGSADYILVMNPDVVLTPDYLKILVAFADAHPAGAAFVGHVRQPNGSTDTTGLRVTPWRVVADRTDLPPSPTEVFGVSGALALYRRSALRDVAVNGEFFCNLLFAYKEDVELAWRLRWAGWRAYCVPDAVATHQRAVRAGTPRNQRARDRRYLSYRNHLLLYGLVESSGTLVPHLPFIALAELLRFGFLTCTDPRTTFRALADARKMWHAARTFARSTQRKNSSAALRSSFA